MYVRIASLVLYALTKLHTVENGHIRVFFLTFLFYSESVQRECFVELYIIIIFPF